MRILLVEDQKYMADAIEYVFKKNKYTIDVSYDGETGLEYALSEAYDVIILDIMLPKINGLDIAKNLRAKNINTPIIMLTAKGEIEDKVLGLDIGADDYLSKPFEMAELLARVRALGRRKDGIIKKDIVIYENIKYNKENLVIECGNKKYELTAKEGKLVEILIEQSEKIVTKEFIISKLWTFEKVVIDNNVEVYISFLRKKFETFNTKVKIKTVRGIGYMLVGEKDV